MERIDEAARESTQETYVRDFLLQSFYHNRNEINKKGDIDYAIHAYKNNESNVSVIIETKRPNSSEMISVANPNAKALQQAVLYFMRERVDENNIDLKYIVVTNIKEWFIFKASDFNRYFCDNPKFRKDYEEWRDKIKSAQKTKDFYNEIAKPELDRLEYPLVCTHFNLKDFADADEKELIALYKIFSPYYLLKEWLANDSNTHEKQLLIENCLFGVDINPNSVKICRLRLWIELLKNAYYKTEARAVARAEETLTKESALANARASAVPYSELETLPNIDINIKHGNSLVSRYALITIFRKRKT